MGARRGIVVGFLLQDWDELDLKKLGKVDEDREEDGWAHPSHYPPPRLPGHHAVVVLDRVPNGAVTFQREYHLKM